MNPDQEGPKTCESGGSGFGSFHHQAKNSKKKLDSYCFVTSFGLFIFEK
jgi:hypothetical protein